MSAFDDRTVFVDVRSQDEIARPPFFPRPFLRHPSEALPEDKTLPIVVFCQSGVRSAQLVESLKEQGYERASNGGGVEEVIEALSMFDTAKGAHVAPIQTQKLALHAELSGHEDTVWAVAWSPNGKFIASCSSDRSVRIWGESRAGTWSCLATLDDGQTRTIRNLAWSPCSRYLVSVSFDATVAVWERQTASNGGEMIWEMAAQLEGHENEVKSACWSADGTLLATSGRDKSVWVWEVLDLESSDFECLAVLQEHTQDVKCVKFHPRGIGASGEGCLVSSSYDDSLKVFGEDGDEWYCVQTLVGHASTVWGFAFAPAGHADEIASVSDDASIILWRKSGSGVGGWSPVQRISQAHNGSIFSADWGDFGLATAGADNAIRVYRSESSPTAPLVLDAEVLQAHDGDVNCVAWSPTTPGLLASAGDDNLVKLWRCVPADKA
mmetsp:Transcript_19826/g.44949  ORF Transcript_19826/g.44949 Transcript_19826/m.44949 type:complete len:438 (+) Transcript_19826:72-1385(+)